jgi:hypothetical protein
MPETQHMDAQEAVERAMAEQPSTKAAALNLCS